MNTLESQNLLNNVANLIEDARRKVQTSVNSAMVHTYFLIGKHIVEYEQHGHERATYGKSVLKDLSNGLTERFGNGWSVENLTLMRKFYLIYSDFVNSVYEIPKTQATILANDAKFEQTASTVTPYSSIFHLSWSHYLVLIRIDNPDERRFYEIEAERQQWSVRQLKRQYGSSLYERLALSRNKSEVMKLACEGHVVEKPADILREPMALEFIGLKPDASYTESDMETAILSKLQSFLLELGKGFLFEARQKRFSFEERNFYIDLVFYNRLLQCYVLIDLKTDDLTHQDLGQMQMYVNYYDRFVKNEFEKPTIGILLCKSKNDALVELTLPKDTNIYAQQYALCLPDKSMLQKKLKEWIADYENNS